MNKEFKSALDKKRIVHFPEAKALVPKELDASKQDLDEAKDRYKSNKFKYATITAYYSMFHSARALLYAMGFREKSHHFLSVALESLYVEKGKLSVALARAFKNAMILREEADYHGDFSEDGAKTTIEYADDFYNTTKQILNRI